MRLAESEKLLDRAVQVIPDATHTYSKGYFMFPSGVPFAVKRGDGAFVWDVDGNRFIDWTAALCAMSLGYNNFVVKGAVFDQLIDGNVFGLPHPIETECAEQFTRMTGYDMVRFGKNGSDATTHAVRLARAITGSDVVYKFRGHYHGCADWAQATNKRCAGIPYELGDLIVELEPKMLPYLEPEQMRPACIILEPVQTEPPPVGYLESLREWCSKNGVLLIFDEVITGFRCAIGGWAEVSGVRPDLACFGKAIANGWPVSALTGKREFMSHLGETFMSYTFGGEAVSLAACKATMDVYDEADIPKQLAANGARVNDFLRSARVPGMVVTGFPWRTVVRFEKDGADDLIGKSVFLQQCFAHGIMTNGQFIPTLAHNEGVQDNTIAALAAVCNFMMDGDYEVIGQPIMGAGVR